MSELSELDDEALQLETESRIFAAALMNRSSFYDRYHDACDEAYDECSKRSRGIYQRAYNAVVKSQGHTQMVCEVDPNGA